MDAELLIAAEEEQLMEHAASGDGKILQGREPALLALQQLLSDFPWRKDNEVHPACKTSKAQQHM